MFDRAWTIICRDASQPVGTVRMLRADADTARARIERARAGTIACAADGDCTVGDSDVAWTTRIEADGDTSYSVEGFAAYADALRIAPEAVRHARVAPGVLKEIGRASCRARGGQDV